MNIIINNIVYMFPLGYKVTLTPSEKINKVVMVNGETRQDIISKRWKSKIEYETATQEILDHLCLIREHSLAVERMILQLEQENGDFIDYEFNIMQPIEFKFKSRQYQCFLYNSVSVNLE
jgi:hypothetical protein